MKAIKTLLASALLAVALPSIAGLTSVTLGFEDATSTHQEVLGRYTGYTFSDTAWMVASPPGRFGGSTGAVQLTSNPDGTEQPANSFTIDIAGGINHSFSLIFGGEAPVTVRAFDENDQELFSNNGSPMPLCTADLIVCDWTQVSMNFGGASIFSIEVEGADGKQWFDNFVFTRSSNDGGTVPEPGGIALSLAALSALALTRRRAKR